MFISLLGLALLLTAVSVWFVTRPLRAAPTVADGERREAYHQLVHVRERLLAQLNELDVDTADRAMDAAVLADERPRLEAELAQVLKRLEHLGRVAPAAAPAVARTSGWAMSAALAAGLTLLAAGLYVANNHAVLARLNSPELIGDPVPPMVREMVARLERRLRDQPQDAEGWARLGRAYEVLGRPDDAQEAYARAHALAPNNAEILAAYAGMLVARSPAQPSDEAVAMFRRLHRMDARHPGALWVLGLVAYNERKYRQAIQYWEALLKELPPQSEAAPEINRALDAARSRMSLKK